MRKEVLVSVDGDLYDKFTLACGLTGEGVEQALDTCFRSYIARAIERERAEEPAPRRGRGHGGGQDDWGKALQRIPLWASRPNQYNHKIIRAYFLAEERTGQASLSAMEGLCSNPEDPTCYVPTFRSNYASMKLDSGNAHGKVFEDDGDRVWLWEEVRDTLLAYRDSFCAPRG